MIKVSKKLDIFADNLVEESLVSKIETLAESSEFPNWASVIESSKNARVCSFEEGGKKYLFKAFLGRDIWEPIKNIFSGSRALRAERGTRLLIGNGLNAPIIICLGSGRGVTIGDSFIVTDFIESDFNVAIFFRDIKDIYKRRSMARDLGKIVGSMHSKHVYHGDMRPGNVLIKEVDGENVFYFIDNERNKERPNYNESMAIVNLVQLNMLPLSTIGKSDRVRFYREYCKKLSLDREQSKRIATIVWQRTEDRMDGRKSGGLYN